MFCTCCGKSNPPHANYCHNCGVSLPALPGEDAPDAQNEPSQRRGFIARHWRGDLPLGVSYWLIGVALTVLVLLALPLLGEALGDVDLDARASGAAVLGFYLFAVALTAWQLVGIWRSAGRHVARGGRRLWARLARVMVVIGVLRALFDFSGEGVPLVSEGVRLLVGIDTTPAYQLRLVPEASAIELRGGMPFGTTAAVIELLDRHPAVEVVQLNSVGGRLHEAMLLAGELERRRLVTHTSDECSSACVVVYLAGRKRYLAPGARLGFHSASVAGLGGELAQEPNREMAAVFRHHGLPENFIRRALATPHDTMWYPPAEELLALGVIHAIVDVAPF